MSSEAEAERLVPRHPSFQQQVYDWAVATFDKEHVTDEYVRSCRFGEEAIELLQAMEVTKADVLKLVDYVYGRPVGVVSQEVGGTLITLAVLCHILNIKMDICGDAELDRCWQNVEKIRAKQAQKPAFSKDPLPGNYENVQNFNGITEKNVPMTEREAMGVCTCHGDEAHLAGSHPRCIHFDRDPFLQTR